MESFLGSIWFALLLCAIGYGLCQAFPIFKRRG